MSNLPFLQISAAGESCTLALGGEWSLHNINAVVDQINTATLPPDVRRLTCDGGGLSKLDTAGAMFLVELFETRAPSAEIKLENFHPGSAALLQMVTERMPVRQQERPRGRGLFSSLGSETIRFGKNLQNFLAFLGQYVIAIGSGLRHPSQLRLKEFTVQLEISCIRSIPVVTLVNFLIGLVVAYIFADQVRRYGANIFVVDGVALAMSRELAPMLVAIVMAGRSGSAFTAQIGAMKVSEELDAIEALGLSLMKVLVVPRVFALAIAMPLLTVLADLVGILGGAIIAQVELGITWSTFMQRLLDNVPFRHFVLGVIKAPFFALFIVLIGCRMGLNVERNTRSVGLSTTSTVVQSIVAVILLDALFAILFMKFRV